MAEDWNQRLADKIRGMRAHVPRATQILNGPIGSWIKRYHGGAPVGLLIAHVEFETGGDIDNVGMAELGEHGAMSVTSSFPPQIGMPADSRLDPETNIFLGCTELQIDTIQLARKIPELELGSADSWKMGHLAFVIGFGGTLAQVNAARAAGYIRAGRVYLGLVDWVRSRGGVALSAGSQDAGKVGYRIQVVQVRWDLGQLVAPGAGGMPRLPPQPPRYRYQIPASLLPYFNLTGGSSILPLVALLVGGAYLYRRLSR